MTHEIRDCPDLPKANGIAHSSLGRHSSTELELKDLATECAPAPEARDLTPARSQPHSMQSSTNILKSGDLSFRRDASVVCR